MSEYTIRMPIPHAKQAAFLDSPAKRKVIVAGRRGGKTTGVSIMAADAAMGGRRVLEAAPVATQTDAFWDAVRAYFAEPIAAGVVRKNETERMLQMPNGGRIRCKTAHDADTLRGDYADFLILDEYQHMNPDAWDKVGAPMLLDNNGDAVFIGTPERRNHFYVAFNRAAADDTGRWAAWHFTSHDNPYLSASALDEITQDMTTEAYRQEILAEFIEGEGQVFRNLAACMGAPDAQPGDHSNHRIVAGVDWGKQADWTCVSIGCADCHVELARDRYNQIDYVLQRARLTALCEQWKPASILAESNSMGEPIIEVLQREGLPVTPFQTTASTKPPLIENLALTLERTEWQFQADPVWTAELEAYERTVSPVTGRSSYSAPQGMHDDTVMARALMVWQAMQREPMTFIQRYR